MTLIEYLNDNTLMLAICAGAAGGMVNCILFEKGFTLPNIEPFEEEGIEKRRLNTGFVGNIALGVASAVIVWGLGASSIDPQRLIAICLFSGVSGGSLITSMMQKSSLSTKIDEISALQEVLDSQKYELDLQGKKLSAMQDLFTKMMKKKKKGS